MCYIYFCKYYLRKIISISTVNFLMKQTSKLYQSIVCCLLPHVTASCTSAEYAEMCIINGMENQTLSTCVNTCKDPLTRGEVFVSCTKINLSLILKAHHILPGGTVTGYLHYKCLDLIALAAFAYCKNSNSIILPRVCNLHSSSVEDVFHGVTQQLIANTVSIKHKLI